MGKLTNVLNFQVAPFLHPFLENFVYEMKFGMFKGLKRKGGLGFVSQFLKPSPEEQFYLNADLKNQTVYDVGAASGLYTIFFAKAVGENGRVIAFEPNSASCQKTRENVRLNHFENVTVLPVALGKGARKDTLIFFGKKPGVGSLAPTEKEWMRFSKDATSLEVIVDSLDKQIQTRNLPAPNFVKIDVQGLELEVLEGMHTTIQHHKPKILVEIHAVPFSNWKQENLCEVIKFLIKKGYSILHVESKTYINLTNYFIVEPDNHLFCKPNLA